MTQTAYRCPTKRHPDDTRTSRYDQQPTGCGCIFTDTPQPRGWVTCPQCNLSFDPTQEIAGIVEYVEE